MNKAYYLSTCSTCSRIIKQINNLDSFEMQDIKTNALTEKQVEDMRSRTDSYESLFSRRAVKYKAMGLKDRDLTENNFKKLLIEEYTFLKRPVFIVEDSIFIGNAKKTIDSFLQKANSLD